MAFCKSAKSEVKNIMKLFTSFIQAHITTALTVTTGFQKLISGVGGDIITTLIPGTIDDAIRAKLLKILPYAIDTLTIMDHCRAQVTLQAKAACWIAEIKKVDPMLQQALLKKMADIITRELDNNKLAQNVYDLFVQAQFSIEKK